MRPTKYMRGFSLIEVMIALVISMILIGSVVATFVSSNNTYAELTNTSRQIENGRYAIATLESEIMHAGYYGEYIGALGERDSDAPPSPPVPSPCTDGPSEFLAGLLVPIYGYDGLDTVPGDVAACVSNYQPNTDILVIRRVSTVDAKAGGGVLDPDRVYFQGFMDEPSGHGVTIDYGNGGPFDQKFPNNNSDVPVRAFLQRIYYIASCARCDGTDNDNPTLTRVDYVGEKTFETLPLVEGIERMEIRYGVSNAGVNEGSPSDYMVASAMKMDPDWDTVMTVEVNLLARNNKETRGHEDSKTYSVGDQAYGPFKDKRRRHVFSQVVRAVNVSSRREQ